jgi:hypothetical protein
LSFVMQRRRSFALLLTLYLVAMLAASGTALAFTAMTETVLAHWSGNDLDHKLLMESLVVCLPHLLKQRTRAATATDGRAHEHVTVAELPGGRVAFVMRPERGKFAVASQPQESQLRARLEQLAREHGLDAENIQLAPVTVEESAPRQSYYWFDQVIDADEFEEVFRWRFHGTEDAAHARPAAWSDLLSFWSAASGELYSLELETSVGTDSRRWFLVVRMEGAKASIECAQRI